MINTLDEQECFELLTTTTIGRIGFLRADAVQIIPVNYALDDRDLIVRTSADGILSDAANGTGPVSFEVDHHHDIAGTAWSVLMHGSLDLADPEPAVLPTPWAGGGRELTLRFVPDSVSGRSVRRDRP